MLGRLVAWYYERLVYRIPKRDDRPLFCDRLTPGQCYYVLGMLKELFYCLGRSDCETVEWFIDGIAESIYQSSYRLSQVGNVEVQVGRQKLEDRVFEDFTILSIIVCLCTTVELSARVKTFLNVVSPYHVDPSVGVVMNALLQGDHKKIQSNFILGEGHQNKIARLNGMRSLGLTEYKKQMACMTQCVPYPRFEREYAFLYDLPASSLGMQFVKMMQAQTLPVVGQPGGFASFFLWHDLTHLLAGCSTTFTGELNANAFTAGASKKCRRRILLFGLLQFNLGIPLAIVARTSADQFTSQHKVNSYFKALLNGSRSLLDVCQWDLDTLKADLKKDIHQVRQEYNIIPL